MASLNHLSIKDVPKIRDEIWEARSSWKAVGLALGVNSGALEAISVMNRGDPSICLTEMLAASVRSTPTLTWRALRDVLMQPAVGMGVLAQQIEEKYDVESESDKPGGRYYIKIIHRAAVPAAAPSMNSLKEWNVISTIAHKWEMLAAHLGIKYVHQTSDPKVACEEVLVRWLKGEGRPPTWKQLLEVFDEVDLSGLAAELRKKLRTESIL